MVDSEPVRTSSDDMLLCPKCGGDATHVETVQIAARAEDRDFNEIFVHAVSGEVKTQTPTPAPAGKQVGHGRRHRIVLNGSCEECGEAFSLVFTQHKGGTFVEWASPTSIHPSMRRRIDDALAGRTTPQIV